MAMWVVEAIYKLKYLIFCQQKNKGKMARAQGKTQGKHREFVIDWSVATLEFCCQQISVANSKTFLSLKFFS